MSKKTAQPYSISLTMPSEGGLQRTGTLVATKGDNGLIREFHYCHSTDVAHAVKTAIADLEKQIAAKAAKPAPAATRASSQAVASDDDLDTDADREADDRIETEEPGDARSAPEVASAEITDEAVNTASHGEPATEDVDGDDWNSVDITTTDGTTHRAPLDKLVLTKGMRSPSDYKFVTDVARLLLEDQVWDMTAPLMFDAPEDMLNNIKSGALSTADACVQLTSAQPADELMNVPMPTTSVSAARPDELQQISLF